MEKSINKNITRNLSIAKILTVAMTAVLAVSAGGSWIIAKYIGDTLIDSPATWQIVTFAGTIIACCLLAGGILFNVYKVLSNIEHDIVFDESNVKKLGTIVTLLLIIFGVCTVAGILVWLTLIVIGFIAVFIAILVKMVELCFAKAVAMKNELDYTV